MSTTSRAARADAELDLTALHDYLSRETELSPGRLSATLVPGGRSNPTYVVTDGETEWVLRRPPHGVVLETAHDMGREYRVLSALAGTEVPAPRPVVICHDPAVIGAPFYLMERLVGLTIRDRAVAESLTPQERRRFADAMVDVLVTLHEIDPQSVGLADWARPHDYLERQLKRWRKQWDAAHSHELPEIDELFALLERTLPVTRYPGIVHGDYKVDNLMIASDDPGHVLGLLDWEMSTLGDTLADVGLMISFWDEVGRPFNPLSRGTTALEGFPTAQEIVEAYAQRRGIDPDDIEWYVAFADTKIAIILEGIHVRHLAGHTVGHGFDDIAGMVAPLVHRALDAARTLDTTHPASA